jgi:hypothetical protein
MGKIKSLFPLNNYMKDIRENVPIFKKRPKKKDKKVEK